MANTKPSAFTADSTPDDSDIIPYIDLDGGGAGVHLNKKITLSELVAYIEARGRQHNASVANQTPAANTDTYITGSDVACPQSTAGTSRLQAKSKYTLTLMITKGAAGTGTPVFTVRFGTAGTTADTARLTFTWPAANTAVADEMKVTIEITFRTVGSGTAAVMEGELMAEHELTTTGFGGTGLGANIIVNVLSAGFDSTPAGSKIGCSVNGGTASAWTIRQARAVLENLA